MAARDRLHLPWVSKSLRRDARPKGAGGRCFRRWTIENAYSSMSLSNTCRIDRPCRMNFLEAETGMIWVSLKMSISCTSLLLNLFGKLLETGTEARCRVGFHNCSGLSGFVLPLRCSLSAS